MRISNRFRYDLMLAMNVMDIIIMIDI